MADVDAATFDRMVEALYAIKVHERQLLADGYGIYLCRGRWIWAKPHHAPNSVGADSDDSPTPDPVKMVDRRP